MEVRNISPNQESCRNFEAVLHLEKERQKLWSFPCEQLGFGSRFYCGTEIQCSHLSLGLSRLVSFAVRAKQPFADRSENVVLPSSHDLAIVESFNGGCTPCNFAKFRICTLIEPFANEVDCRLPKGSLHTSSQRSLQLAYRP